MKLSILVKENPLANTIGHQGYVEPEHAVMHKVKSWLEQAVNDCNIRLTDEPVLLKQGWRPPRCHIWSMTLRPRPVSESLAGKMQEREADLKARGLLS